MLANQITTKQGDILDITVQATASQHRVGDKVAEVSNSGGAGSQWTISSQ